MLRILSRKARNSLSYRMCKRWDTPQIADNASRDVRVLSQRARDNSDRPPVSATAWKCIKTGKMKMRHFSGIKFAAVLTEETHSPLSSHEIRRKRTRRQNFSLDAQEENHPFSHCRYSCSFRSPLTSLWTFTQSRFGAMPPGWTSTIFPSVARPGPVC